MKNLILLMTAVLMAMPLNLYAGRTKSQPANQQVRKYRTKKEQARILMWKRQEKKLDAFLDSVYHSDKSGTSTKSMVDQLIQSDLGEKVLLSRYIKDNLDKLSNEQLYVLTASIFGEGGDMKIKGFNPTAYFKHNDESQQRQFNIVAQKEQKRMQYILIERAKNEKDFAEKKAKLETLRAQLYNAVTSDHKYGWKGKSDEDFLNTEPKQDIDKAKSNGITPSSKLEHEYYGAFFDAKNAYNKDKSEKEQNKDVDSKRLKAFENAVVELGACLDCNTD